MLEIYYLIIREYLFTVFQIISKHSCVSILRKTEKNSYLSSSYFCFILVCLTYPQIEFEKCILKDK